MSRPRYAPITASLLVRKGEAKPWTMPGMLDFPPAERREDQAQAAASPPVAAWEPPPPLEWEPPVPQIRPATAGGGGPGEPRERRCTVKLSALEYERLGIVAVKREITRQQALHQAIERYLAAASQEFRSACGCLGGSCRGDC